MDFKKEIQTLSPRICYEQKLLEGNFLPDDLQKKAILHLDVIHKKLITYKYSIYQPTKGLFSFLYKIINFVKNKKNVPVRGLYIWGDVGCGKTWIMDLFFQSIPNNRKLRMHFNRFMLYVHEELMNLQGESDPLLIIADRFKTRVDVLCFDEFFISNTTDAMILCLLIEIMLKKGILLIATSNIPPDNLYINGLQRTRFMPFINTIKYYCDVINLNSGIDYRLRKLTTMRLWYYPINKETNFNMERMFYLLSGVSRKEALILEINHRNIPTLGVNGGVLAIDFLTVCGEGRSQYDYIELSSRFHSVLIYDMPMMIYDTECQAKRFLMLVDEFYDRHVKMVVSAETSIDKIYQGKRLKYEYKRCLSRLQEMQSKEYFYSPHLP